MSDLIEVLPGFETRRFSHLLHSLDKNDITVVDLITLDPVEIVRRCPLPLAEVRRLVVYITELLQNDLVTEKSGNLAGKRILSIQEKTAHCNNQSIVSNNYSSATVQTLDPEIDQLLGGGFRLGHISEIVGESSAGKTQFVLGLLLSVQLLPPRGLGKAAIYLSTESRFSTGRLAQMLESHPIYQETVVSERPSLDSIHLIAANDLETQSHIVEHQLPVAMERFNVGLVVMDSVAANFRAEHETRTAGGLAGRAAELTKLGSMLRKVATEYGAAVIVTNQVADRFDDSITRADLERLRSSSPVSASSPISQSSNLLSQVVSRQREVYSLDRQQRFFTGWGNGQNTSSEDLKTPALGLAWANQISARIVLKFEDDDRRPVTRHGETSWTNKKRKRLMSLVFAPWTDSLLKPVEYQIAEQGVITTKVDETAQLPSSSQMSELLADDLWVDEDEEFP